MSAVHAIRTHRVMRRTRTTSSAQRRVATMTAQAAISQRRSDSAYISRRVERFEAEEMKGGGRECKRWTRLRDPTSDEVPAQAMATC